MSNLQKLYLAKHVDIEAAVRCEIKRDPSVLAVEPLRCSQKSRPEWAVVSAASQLILFEFEMAALEYKGKQAKTENFQNMIVSTVLFGVSTAFGIGGGVMAFGLGCAIGAFFFNELWRINEKGVNDRTKAFMLTQGVRPQYKSGGTVQSEVYNNALQMLEHEFRSPSLLRQRLVCAQSYYEYK